MFIYKGRNFYIAKANTQNTNKRETSQSLRNVCKRPSYFNANLHFQVTCPFVYILLSVKFTLANFVFSIVIYRFCHLPLAVFTFLSFVSLLVYLLSFTLAIDSEILSRTRVLSRSYTNYNNSKYTNSHIHVKH